MCCERRWKWLMTLSEWSTLSLKAEIKQKEAHEHFDSSWRKLRAIPLCLFERMVSEEVGEQGREETLWLTCRLRVGASDCLGGERDVEDDVVGLE